MTICKHNHAWIYRIDFANHTIITIHYFCPTCQHVWVKTQAKSNRVAFSRRLGFVVGNLA